MRGGAGLRALGEPGQDSGRPRAGSPGPRPAAPGGRSAAACVRLGFPPALAAGKGICSGARPKLLWVAWLALNETARSARCNGAGHLQGDLLTLLGF